MRRTLFAGLAVSLALLALPARAAPTEGERLFREGRNAMNERDYATACARFAESQKAEPAPGTLLNLGDCEEHRGHLLAAKDAFMLAAAAYSAADKKQYATQRGDALEQRVPRLVLRTSAPVFGLTIVAGGVQATLGAELKMDPGEVTITASAPNRRDKILHATLKESRTVELDIGALEEDRPAAGPQPREEPRARAADPVHTDRVGSDGSGRRTLGFVVGGVGIAAVAGGAVTGLMTLGRASTVKAHCDGALACDPEGLDAARSGATLSLVSTILFVAGAVGLGAGTFLVLTSPRSTTAFVPQIGERSASLGVRSTF